MIVAPEQRPVKQGSAEDAAFMLKNASKVIIVELKGDGWVKADPIK